VSERIVPLDLGLTPWADVSGALLLQSEYSAFLLFNARKVDGGEEGRAVIAFENCTATRFGYPNDEAWYGIPRTRDLSYGCYEVLDSGWARELTLLNRHSFPDTPDFRDRHFLFLFHDSSFECLAEGLQATLSVEPTAELLARLCARIRSK
jgi:hypothetical protein